MEGRDIPGKIVDTAGVAEACSFTQIMDSTDPASATILVPPKAITLDAAAQVDLGIDLRVSEEALSDIEAIDRACTRYRRAY